MSCNRSGYEVDYNSFYTEHEVWLSEGNIKDMNALFEIGAATSGLAEALVTWGVIESSTPPGVGVAIASVLLLEKGLINFFADRCGVKITIYTTSTVNTPYSVAFQTIESQ